MAGLRDKKLRGSTLPEVLIALTIVTVVMVVAYNLITSLGESVNTVDKFRAMTELNRRMSSEPEVVEYRDTIYVGSIRLIEENRPYMESDRLYKFSVKAETKKGMILCKRSVVKVLNDTQRQDK